MKCRDESEILMSSRSPCTEVIGNCEHKYCQSCFRKENRNTTICSNRAFTCPCCHINFYGRMQSIDEAILVGEASTLSAHLSPQLSASDTIIAEDIAHIKDINVTAIEKLESALLLDSNNFYALYLLFLICWNGNRFLLSRKMRGASVNEAIFFFYGSKIFNYTYQLLDHPAVSGQYEILKTDCYIQLANVFQLSRNITAAVKYYKLAYEHCLRSADHTMLADIKRSYIKARAEFVQLPPLQFAIGDEVEFLLELETGGEWKLGKIVELYYRERHFDMPFTAPYRLQLINDSEGEPPEYAWVKADIDRYVRKVGVRSIEDTRYQARLDAKVEELDQVYCSDQCLHDIYSSLAQDNEFVEMLLSVWQVELSVPMLSLYRMLVMYRQPLTRTDSGYHVPTAEEIIAGIRAYFDPAHLSDDAAASVLSEDGDPERVRAYVMSIFNDTFVDRPDDMGDVNVQVLLLRAIREYNAMISRLDYSGSYAYVDLVEWTCDFTVPPEVSEAVSRASTKYDIINLGSNSARATKVDHFITAWVWLFICLKNSDAGPVCECPLLYFFVKYCLDRNLGVPKLALALYDRMNLQLSRDFIRCANPTCELNKLDQSTGRVKFKQCSRCQAVIYCSRECQVAHYPEHKRLCTERATEKGHNSEGISSIPRTYI